MIVFEMLTLWPWLNTHRRAARTVAMAAVGLAIMAALITYVVFTHRFQIAGAYVERVNTSEKVVALTFDDGPQQAAVDEILPILASRNTPATFYILGVEAERNPRSLRDIAEAGHEIGNHTYSHLSLAFANHARIEDELVRTDRAIRASGYSGPITFRPSYGHKLFALPLYLKDRNMITISRDVPADSNIPDNATAQTIADKATKLTKPGSIILLHVMYPINYKSRDAVPLIIDQLKAKGYRFVTVSQLLRYNQL